MADSMKLAEMQRTSIEFERQRHLANWFIKSSPHMATPQQQQQHQQQQQSTASSAATTTTTTATALSGNGGNTGNGTAPTSATTGATTQQTNAKHSSGGGGGGGGGGNNSATNPPVFFLMSSNGNTGTAVCHATPPPNMPPTAGSHVEGRKPKLRRFNSHDTSSNMFSVADFENARLARRNEIEMKQRLQRRMRGASANGGSGISGNGGGGGNAYGAGLSGVPNGGGAASGAGGCGSMGGDYSTGDSKASKYSNDSQHEPLPADLFLDRYSLPRVVRISYKTKFSDETLQSSSSNGSSTVTSSSSAASGTAGGGGGGAGTIGTGTTGTATSSSTASSSGGGGVNVHTNTHSSGSGSGNTKHHQSNSVATVTAAVGNATTNGGVDAQDSGDLFLLYRLIRQRHIYHGHNAKSTATNRKKGVLIPQEFPGYFSLINDKGLPTATLYTSLIQLVRERVYKFVSVDNMPAFTESQPNQSQPASEGCLPIYNAPPQASSNRPQYVKTTARGGQVFRLLAVFEDGKQDHNAISSGGGGSGNGSISAKPNTSHGREKEKGRYAQLLNENRQVVYVSLSTKGKFYEIEPGIPQILQKLSGGMGADPNKKVNADCVHRITALVTPNKELPLTLRYISGPSGCANAIPEQLSITKITTENVAIACPIEDIELQSWLSPLQLRKLHLTKEMNLLKSSLGFENEQRMLANPNVQNLLKYCQFNCDQFLKMVEVEILSRPERSASKSRVDGLKILKPLHLPKLLRREKTSISAHEKEDSIIFLSKTDLANLEAKGAAAAASSNATLDSSTTSVGGSTNRISDKMKVFQTTKKKWFRKQDKHAVSSLTSLDLDVQAKRMSMERYSDMSKLLQERFGDKPNSNSASQEHESISEPSAASDLGCSDTETTTLATIEEKLKKFSKSSKHTESQPPPMLQKSMSLQDIELISGGNSASRKPDLLSNTHADTISEAGTDLEDLENCEPPPQSFITEKLYNEFHVKTRQYSKSSSSLHQLLNFSLPQKLQVHDAKRSLAQIKHNAGAAGTKSSDKRLDFNIGEPVTGRRAAGGINLLAGGSSGHSQNTSLISPLTPTSLLEDDLPYSSVRDSLVLSSDDSGAAADQQNTSGGGVGGGHYCPTLQLFDYAKENIYAEICHEASAMGGIPHAQTRDTFSAADTHSTHIYDDYGDYASLSYPTATAATHATLNGNGNGNFNGISAGSVAGNAISRVQINCSSSPVSYHTVYLGEEPLGEHYATVAAERQKLRTRQIQRDHSQQSRGGGGGGGDRAHITTVELEGVVAGSAVANGTGADEQEAVDNIYNTLK